MALTAIIGNINEKPTAWSRFGLEMSQSEGQGLQTSIPSGPFVLQQKQQ